VTAQMLAVRVTVGERDLRLERLTVPEPGPREVRVRVAAAGVCHTDVHLIDG
jgi:propanol-preferring alcohol dehydrogenase